MAEYFANKYFPPSYFEDSYFGEGGGGGTPGEMFANLSGVGSLTGTARGRLQTSTLIVSGAALQMEIPGAPVTLEEKQQRADEIATALGNHTLWRSHGRSIDLPKLAAMRIQIDDYSDDHDFRTLIREYNDPLTGFIDRMGLGFFMHNHRVGL